MSKLNDLIPPDVTVSASTTAQIMSRALKDAQGWFDPLKEPARTYAVLEEHKVQHANIIQEILDNDGLLIELVKRGLGKFLPRNGDMVVVDVPSVDECQGAADLTDEHGQITQVVFMNQEGEVQMLSLNEYNEVYGC